MVARVLNMRASMPVEVLHTTMASAPSVLRAQHIRRHVGLGRIDIGDINNVCAILLQRLRRIFGRSYAVTSGVGDHRDLLHFQDLDAIGANRVVPLSVRGRGAERVWEFLGIDQAVDHTWMNIRHFRARHDRGDGERFTGIGRAPDGMDFELADHFLRGIYSLGRIALRVTG